MMRTRSAARDRESFLYTCHLFLGGNFLTEAGSVSLLLCLSGRSWSVRLLCARSFVIQTRNWRLWLLGHNFKLHPAPDLDFGFLTNWYWKGTSKIKSAVRKGKDNGKILKGSCMSRLEVGRVGRVEEGACWTMEMGASRKLITSLMLLILGTFPGMTRFIWNQNNLLNEMHSVLFQMESNC